MIDTKVACPDCLEEEWGGRGVVGGHSNSNERAVRAWSICFKGQLELAVAARRAERTAAVNTYIYS